MWDVSGQPENQCVQIVKKMTDAIAHRGPDDQGVWYEGGVTLGHRRLSIVDLSQLGHQPMTSSDGRFILVYNGEVYNFRELRRELEGHGHRFQGSSDTEVILAATVQWGLERSVKRFVGMFALALWDRKERELTLVRDRLGIKPLYMARTPGGDLLFASELGAIAQHPAFVRTMSPEAVTEFMRLGYIRSPRSIFRFAQKVAPGTLIRIRHPKEEAEVVRYWSVEDASPSGPKSSSFDERREILHEHFVDAVRCRMIADVPLGAFLSGGIDSSLITGIMASISDRPVKTFSVGFTEASHDESVHARAVAEHLGTDHTELLVTVSEAQEVLLKMPEIYDEPFADSSQIPTYLVARLARSEVTVALSGEGGDELFAGYRRYRTVQNIWRVLRRIPRLLRAPFGATIQSAVTMSRRPSWDFLALPRGLDRRRIQKAADLVMASSPAELDERLASEDHNTIRWLYSDGMRDLEVPPNARASEVCEGGPLVEQLMLRDLKSYLPDDLLTKADRATMAVSLEARMPLLDHRIVEYARGLPVGDKLQGSATKVMLRDILYEYVPPPLVDRPKVGFEVPLASWLRGGLATEVGGWVEGDLVTSGEIFSPTAVRSLFEAHRRGADDSGDLIWRVMMLEQWRHHWSATL